MKLVSGDYSFIANIIATGLSHVCVYVIWVNALLRGDEVCGPLSAEYA